MANANPNSNVKLTPSDWVIGYDMYCQGVALADDATDEMKRGWLDAEAEDI